MADNLNDSINSEQAQYRVSQLEKLYETEKKEGEIKDLNKQNEINNAKIEKQRIVAYLLMGIVIIIAIFTILQMRAAKRIKKSRAQLQIQKELIEEQKIQVDEAYHKLHESNKEVLDSIHYAARIQRSLITSERYIKKELGRMNKG